MTTKTPSRPTIQDIAKQTGYSIATVSRALHQESSPNVSAKTRERVRSTANELGYQANLMGRSLAAGRSHTISFWTQNIFSSYYMKITEQICQQARNRKYHIIINGVHDPAHVFEVTGAGFGNPLASNHDGVIGCDVSFSANHHAEIIQRNNIPFVGIGFNTAPNRDSVAFDIYAVGILAVEHLLDVGARRIAILTTEGEDEPRTCAYQRTMSEAGLPTQIIHLKRENRPHAREAILAFVAEQRALGRALPEAIFCKNDEATIGCYRALCELGVRVPHDILLIGCDGLEEMAYQSCSLSSVALPVDEMCHLAWEMLESRIGQQNTPVEHKILKPQLIIRESTQPNFKSCSESNHFRAEPSYLAF